MNKLFIKCAWLHFLSNHFSFVWFDTNLFCPPFQYQILVVGKRLSIRFFLIDNFHKATPLSHIKDLHDNVVATIGWCTPRSLAMPLIEDDPALIDVVKMLCFTTSSTFECACFVFYKKTRTLAISSWAVTKTFGGKNDWGILEEIRSKFPKTFPITTLLFCGPWQITNDFVMLWVIVVASLVASHSPMTFFATTITLAMSFWQSLVARWASRHFFWQAFCNVSLCCSYNTHLCSSTPTNACLCSYVVGLYWQGLGLCKSFLTSFNFWLPILTCI